MILGTTTAAAAVDIAGRLDELANLIKSSQYEDVLTQGTALLDSLTQSASHDPLQEARLIDLMVNACYRGERVMEDRFLELARRAVALNEANAGPTDLATATSLMHLGNLLSHRGDYQDSVIHYERAIGILAALGSAHDQQRAVLLSSEGVALRKTGAYDRARERYEQALAIQENLLGPDHPDVASTLNNLSIILRGQGQYRAARDIGDRALRIREAYFGPQHEWVAESLHNLANTETLLGAYDEAIKVQERAVAIFRATLGEDHQRYWWASLNLGLSYLDMGDHEGGLPICESVLAAQRRIYGHDNINVTYALEAVGSCHFKAGRFDEALVIFRETLQIIEDTVGVGNSETGHTMFEVGRCQVELGQLQEGAATLSRSLKIQEESSGEDSSELCDLLHCLAEAHLHLERPGDAIGFSRRSRDILEVAVGPDHPLYAEALLLEARGLATLGERRKAQKLALRAENISRRHLQHTMRVLSEARALDYATSRVQGLDVALSLLPPDASSEQVAPVWDAAVRSRAVVLDEYISRNANLSATAGPRAAALLDSSLAVRELLANFTLRGPGYEEDDLYVRTLDGYRRDLDRLERQLSLADPRQEESRLARTLGQAEILDALPQNTALVSYVLYQRPIGSPAQDERRDHVLAMVVASHLPGPVAVDLGPAAEISTLVRDWRDQVLFGSRVAEVAAADGTRGLVHVAGKPAHNLDSYLVTAEALRRKVWDPLGDSLETCDQVFLVPAGILHQVNFGALPSRDGTFLAETGPVIHTLLSERSVAQLAADVTATPGILAIGDPDFGDPRSSDSSERMLAADSPCADLTALHFGPLPHAREEVAQLVDIWRTVHADRAGEVEILTGAAATEAAFKRQIGRHGVLHLATHGFVLDNACQSTGDRNWALNLTGLALSDANNWAEAADGGNDGILTAAEIAGLDLGGVDWAVLSACDTGLGELTTRGEGVFGLCRAFALAGARTVIVSLWPVGDEAARDWMQALYTARLAHGASTADAVRTAHQTVLADRRAAGLSLHPYYWAGFTAVGGWQ
jgi:CHAT domain-containing protein/tetratricopeptide (TPR) repeat protein